MATKNYSWNRNLASNILGSQVYGRCMRRSTLSQEFVQGVDRRFQFKEIPMLLAKLERNSSPDKFNIAKCVRYLRELSSFFKEPLHMMFGEYEPPYHAKEILRLGQVVNLFGGVEIVVQILFYPDVYELKSRKMRSTRTQQDQLHLISLCLDFIHQLCLVVDGVATSLAKKNYLISHLFTLLKQKITFAHASAVLEDLLGSRKELIDLDSILNMKELMDVLDEQQLANLCRVLSFSLTDIESVEERSTLLAQDELEKKGMSQKDVADNNQATLIGLEEFLPRLVAIARQPLVERSFSSGLYGGHEHGAILDIVDFQAFLQDVLISERLDLADSSEHDAVPILQSSFKRMHEVMFKVEVFYVLCLFLTGKHKSVVQKRLSELMLIPGMCQMFDKMPWLQETDSLRHEVMDIDSGDHECTPQTALKIQFLRLVHSFCDRHENKHLLLTPREIEELQQLYVQNGLAIPDSLSETNRKLCCVGNKGLLTKILETLIRSPVNAPLRFWLSRAIEGFLRGRASVGDQLFLIKRELLEHLVDHITSEELKPKEILQSSFDLLGELMKFNPFAFKRFDQVISEKQFEKFVSILTSNVVDSNMLIRCLVLSQEHFTSTRFFTEFSTEACKLGTLISNWDQMIFLLYKLINSITVGTLTQENVSCLNTTLVFLMFAHRHGCLPSYLVAFVREENLQKNPGFIMSNLRLLLEFWKTHYLKRGKDCSALEQSSCISFDHWKQVVDILLSDPSCNTSVLHYLPVSCTRDC